MVSPRMVLAVVALVAFAVTGCSRQAPQSSEVGTGHSDVVVADGTQVSIEHCAG